MKRKKRRQPVKIIDDLICKGARREIKEKRVMTDGKRRWMYTVQIRYLADAENVNATSHKLTTTN